MLLASRRQILGSAALASASFLVGSSAALADVADGNELPDGVAQFARLVKAKSDIVVRYIRACNVLTSKCNVAHD